ncbi:MAG: LysR family transcriptional regulator [Pseudomonadales bacterium]|nr:LysR family transcriptional regulator [Pseudomonadales bacterium]
MLDLDSIKAFVAVAETGSFSTAANRLHLTQPAVSKRIALLEGQMDVKLFDRIGRTVTLTEAGRELEPRAREILLNIEDTQRAIRNLTHEVSGQLSIATSHHIGLWRLPAILRAYSERYPRVALDLHFMDSEVAHEQIVQGNLELGIITMAPTNHERLLSRHIWTDDLIFVCAEDHELARAPAISLAQIAEFPAILPDMSTFTGRIVKHLFEDEGLAINISMSTNYLETIRMLIKIGLGWSVLPSTMLGEGIHPVPVTGISIQRKLGVIHHVQRTLSNAAVAFMTLLDEQRDASAMSD